MKFYLPGILRGKTSPFYTLQPVNSYTSGQTEKLRIDRMIGDSKPKSNLNAVPMLTTSLECNPRKSSTSGCDP